MDECGFDSLGTDDEIGFDYMSLLKGGAGMLSGAGGMFGGGAAGGGGTAQPSAEAQRLQAEKAAAESSARTWKIVGIVFGSLAGVGLLAALALGGHRAPAIAAAAVK